MSQPHVKLLQHRSRSDKPRVWECWASGDAVHTRYGVLDGKMQETRDIPGSVGVPGTKSYVDPVTQAELVVQRMGRKKREEGYVDEGGASAGTLDLSHALLPKNLVLPKPVKEIPDALLKQLGGITDLDFCFTRKRNGMMAVLVRGEDGDVRVLSRKMDDLTTHVPHIAKEAARWLPNGSLLAGELVPPTDEDDFAWVASVVRSLPAKAVRQQQETGRLLCLYLFGVYVWDGEEVWHSETAERLINRVLLLPEGDFVQPLQILFCENEDELARLIRKEGWEGAVLFLRDGIMSPDDISFSGRERRPPVVFKYKLKSEDDFVILDWSKGTGKNMARLGQILLGKPNGDWTVEFGWCGTGFSDKQRAELATDDIVGRVVQVEYDSLTPDGKLLFPRFVRMRDDKTPEETE